MLLPLLLLTPPTAWAATISVNPGDDLQSIIDDAASGDELELAAGSYPGAIVIDDKDLSLIGLGAAVLEAEDDSVVRISDSTVDVVGITIRATGGRGVRTERATVLLRNVDISGNNTARAYNGGAVAAFPGSVLTIEGGTYADNTAESVFLSQTFRGFGGHLYMEDATVEVMGAEFRNGFAELGGAIYATGSGRLDIQDSTFASHEADNRAATIMLRGAIDLEMRTSTIRGGTTAGNGGAIRKEDGGGSITLEGMRIEDNDADFGGAIALNGANTLVIRESSFLRNEAEHGGALSVFDVDSVTVERSTFCANTASEEGGAIRINGSGGGRWTNLVLSENSAGAPGGGGMWIETSEPQFIGWSDVLGNVGIDGAGLHIEGTDVDLSSTLFAFHAGSEAIAVTGGTTTLSYEAFWANDDGDLAGASDSGSPVTTDPELFGYTRDGVCDDDLRRRSTSPLLGAGDPAFTNPDGSVSDIGALGGEGAVEAYTDADGDGVPARSDCDDDDATAYPGADELCDEVDNDCDGLIDGATAIGAVDWFPDLDEDGFGNSDEPLLDCNQPDGFVSIDGDCDDGDATISPDADERCDDVDNDCDGDTDERDAIDPFIWYEDADGDGYGVDEGTTASACDQPDGFAESAVDCDDTRADVNPAAPELCDEVDNNCDGSIDGDDAIDKPTWYVDQDGDGYGSPDGDTRQSCSQPDGFLPQGGDCNDVDATVYPTAPESCDPPLRDTNCDGFVGTTDNDGDGFAACSDCNDNDDQAYPGAPELWYDGIILDCDSLSDFDADRDGYDAEEFGGTDCEDADARIAPGRPDLPDNGIDDDCDGTIDNPSDDELGLGCDGCNSGGAPTFAWLLLPLLALRRRR